MNDCAFCKIIRGELSAEILHVTQHVIAILDINPIHFGHILVIPKAHSVTFVEMPDHELPDLIRTTKIVAEAIVETLKPQGFNIFSNNGKAAGQSVFHVHFHVTPRYNDDQIRFILQLKKYASDEMARYGDRLRRQIQRTMIQE